MFRFKSVSTACIIVTIFIVATTHSAPTSDENDIQQVELPHPLEEGYILFDDMWVLNTTGLGQAKNPVTTWQGGRMPYEFDANYPTDARKDVEAGIRRWNEQLGTCISIVPKTTRDRNYIRIRNSQGCNAVVGRQAQGGQWMSLQVPGCTSKGPVMHEFMHAVGFEHEHQRPDRGNSIVVHFENIVEEWRRWWEVESKMKILGPFNCESIMMYPAVSSSYSIDNKPAFTAKAGKSCTGDYHHDFVPSDIAVIKKLYNCK